jgi:hypothetical protein
LSPAPPATTSPITGGVKGPRIPTLRNSWASASVPCSWLSPNSSSRPLPCRLLTTSRTSRPSRAPRVSSQRSSSNDSTVRSASPSKPAWATVSPPCSPACWAIEPATGLARIGLGSCTPYQFTAAYSSTASSRLAKGPAATIATRERSGWVLKARCRSSGATGPSRSSSILT